MNTCEIMYLYPHKEQKVWGIEGIGEYWYGAEPGKSSVAEISGEKMVLRDVLERNAEGLLGEEAVARFGISLPLVKILTPRKRLSVQFHDKKDELWVVTGIDRTLCGREPELVLGFSADALETHGKDVREKYKEALYRFAKVLNDLIDALEQEMDRSSILKKGDAYEAALQLSGRSPVIKAVAEEFRHAKEYLDGFYNKRSVELGDVIPVPRGTLHALGPGIEVIEPQIPGETQSVEDGATYPVRYYFPGFKRESATKELDVDRVGELGTDGSDSSGIRILKDIPGVKVERLPGGFEEKGLAVERVNINKGSSVQVPPPGSIHLIAAVKGKGLIEHDGAVFEIPIAEPGGKILAVPGCMGSYTLRAQEDLCFIDTFIPV